MLAVLTLLTYGCATTVPPGRATYSFDRRCTPVNSGPKAILVSDVDPAPIKNETSINGEAARSYSSIAVYIAETMDVPPRLNRLARLENESTRNDLHIREAMLQQLEASIQLMHQDLENLLREVLIRQAMEGQRIE